MTIENMENTVSYAVIAPSGRTVMTFAHVESARKHLERNRLPNRIVEITTSFKDVTNATAGQLSL
jgi:hypothetical protein